MTMTNPFVCSLTHNSKWLQLTPNFDFHDNYIPVISIRL